LGLWSRSIVDPAKPIVRAPAEAGSQLLGDPIFEATGSRVRYAGAFEALVEGQGRLAEEASFRLILRASPCGPADVARRAGFFLQRHPGSSFAPEARLWLARAEEEAYWRGGGKDALRRTVDAYQAVANGKGDGAAEARKRLKSLQTRKPQRPASPRVVCR